MSTTEKKLSKNEGLKTASNYLRGTILEGLADPLTGAISEEDNQLTKFHGIYMQDDRDLRSDRRKQKLEKAYMFMIRVRVPGGVCTPKQWLEMDRLATQYANDTLKLTTRQAFQFHGVLKHNLKTTIAEVNHALLDTIAACGDVNRNVMCNPNPQASAVHADVLKLAQEISDHLTPRTRAYHEIWLDEERVAGGEEEEEPIYGKTYLPRKFKIVVAVPPSNDVDIFAHDLGFIAIVEKDKVVGYNITVGGGMGMTHGSKATFPRTADIMGFVSPEKAVAAAEAVVKVQRDYGDRSDRKHARLKYTVEDRGLEWFRAEVEKYAGFQLEEPRDFHFEHTGDRYGWAEGIDGKWNLTLFVQNGRVRDCENGGPQYKTGLREIARIHEGDFRLTANQNVIIGGVAAEAKEKIEALVKEYHLDGVERLTGLRRNSMACVALPTCGLALTESERYLPKLVDRLDEAVLEAGLREQDIVIRMTGCPNGCARPYLAEIGLVGKAPGKYNLYLGAKPDGSRLNKLYKEAVAEEEIVEEVSALLKQYAKKRKDGESFGDWCVRAKVVKATTAGNNFHD